VRDALVDYSKFFDIMLSQSALFPWIMEDWLSGVLENTYAAHDLRIRQEKGKEPRAQDSRISDTDVGDDDADDILQEYPTTISKRIMKWLRLTFATFRYARDLSKQTEFKLADFRIVETKVPDQEMKDWRDTIKTIY